MAILCNTTNTFSATYIRELKHSLDKLDPDGIDRIVDILWSAYVNDKQVFIMGNGGSASTASHFACDLNKSTIAASGKRLRAISLADNTALITALSNDLHYEEVFKEQLINLADPGDVVIAITASGASPNILKAVEYARHNNAVSVGLIGFYGGKLIQLVDEGIVVDSNNYGYVEDIHLILTHVISQSIKHRLENED